MRMFEFFRTYDLLLTPATIVARLPGRAALLSPGAPARIYHYFEWLAIAYAITLACCPALSLPCGFTSRGLPVGLQIVAPPRADASILTAAKILEETLSFKI